MFLCPILVWKKRNRRRVTGCPCGNITGNRKSYGVETALSKRLCILTKPSSPVPGESPNVSFLVKFFWVANRIWVVAHFSSAAVMSSTLSCFLMVDPNRRARTIARTNTRHREMCSARCIKSVLCCATRTLYTSHQQREPPSRQTSATCLPSPTKSPDLYSTNHKSAGHLQTWWPNLRG